MLSSILITASPRHLTTVFITIITHYIFMYRYLKYCQSKTLEYFGMTCIRDLFNNRIVTFSYRNRI